MFDLVNLPEEEDFIRDALVGNVVRLAKVILYTKNIMTYHRMHKGLM
jgi:hypothetical protein